MRDQLLLFSGGTDSLIAWEYLKHPQVLFVNLHTRYSGVELGRVKALAEHLKMDWYIDDRLDLRDMEAQDGSGFIPHRNTFLILIASFYTNRIWLAGLGSDVVIDKSPEYSLNMSSFLTKQLGYRAKSVTVDSPFWNYTKEDTIRWLIAEKGFELAKSLILKSFSCYSDTLIPCGRCQACFRRYVALKLHGIDEEYEVNPLIGCREIIVSKYIPQMFNSIVGSGKYDYRRSIETLGLLYEPFLSNPLIFDSKDLIRAKLEEEKKKIFDQFGITPNYTV